VATISASQERASELNILARKQRSLWLDAFYRLRRNKAAMAGVFVIVLFALLAIFADLWVGPLHVKLAPYDPICQFYVGGESGCGVQGATSGPPLMDPVWGKDTDPRFLLGTDQLGRDVLSRLMFSARISLVVGFIPAIIYFVIGGSVGLVAGYFGGRIDNLLMRLTDVVYAFPDLLLLIIIMATIRDTELGNIMGGLLLIFLALSVVNWVGVARLTRGQVLSLREKEFVEAARCVGASSGRIMFRHLLPNTLAPIIVSLAFSVPVSIFAEAGLSFLGIGIKPPTPSWGVMINEGFAVFAGTPSHVMLPAACIALVMLSFTFLGDGLRDALDPRMKI
jgi:oligopeptide transport system permease protein